MGVKIYKYGIHFDQIEKQIYTPECRKTKWGYYTKIADEGRYGLERLFIKKDSEFILEPRSQESVIFVESGRVNVESDELGPKEILRVAASKSVGISAGEDNSCIYIFFGPSSGEKSFQKSKTFDIRHKDWAENLIETIVNGEYTGKRIFFKKGNKSSLHFHCQKTETYFIHSGKLLLHLRAGHAEDRYCILEPGQAVKITPGLMHQAGALEDLTIIEVSTHDFDTDGFMVENEYAPMLKLKEMLNK